MLKTCMNFKTLFLLWFFNDFVLSDFNKDILLPFNRQLVKRHDNDLQTCLDNFDVHQDKIIRTQDSRQMGAKYINERDVLSRDECLRLCCETESCDVFVFEEKTPGSCYLFECGTPEDFKCKFTRHKNYTSAVLAINRHLTELESQIKFTQHEHELTKLRQPQVEILKNLHPPTDPPKNQEALKNELERPPSLPVVERGEKCSQYQFKCHTSGECIGIYNACDGIPQCADGSDEAVELGCPTTSTTSIPTTTLKPSKTEENNNRNVVEEHKKENQMITPQKPYSDGSVIKNGYAQNPAVSNIPVANPYYGREGEGMINRHSEQYAPHMYHQNQGGSQIFTHKGNGLMPQNNDWYYPHQYIPPEIPQQSLMPQYGDQGANYYDNMGYRIPPQHQSLNNWQTPHKSQEGVAPLVDDPAMSRLDRIPVVNAPAPPEDYYEEVDRNRQQPYPQRAPVLQPLPRPALDTKMHGETPMDMSNEDTGSKHDVPKKKPPTERPETTTEKPKEVTPAHPAHRNVENMFAELKIKESLADEEIEGHSASPSGAVLSLTMGLCITGLMLVFIGCRMKVVGRRMRRGGKSPYAHDADFLVNGMYL